MTLNQIKMPTFKGTLTEVKNNYQELEDTKKKLSVKEDMAELKKISQLLEDPKKVDIIDKYSGANYSIFEVNLDNNAKKTIHLYKNDNEDYTFHVLDSNRNGYKFELPKSDIEDSPTRYGLALMELGSAALLVALDIVGRVFGIEDAEKKATEKLNNITKIFNLKK